MFSLPCSLSKWPLLNLFLLPATFFMASCHFFKELIPGLQNGTSTHWFHTLWHRNKYFMHADIPSETSSPSRRDRCQLQSLQHLNNNYCSSFGIAPPAKETRQCLPLLHKPTEIVVKQSICCVLFPLKHSMSWGVYFMGIMLPRVSAEIIQHYTMSQCRAGTLCMCNMYM